MTVNNQEIFWVIDEHKRQKNLSKNRKGITSSELVNKAIKIAFNAHIGQTDISGCPYILHPLHVAAHMKGDYAVCAALLHDVVENSDITFKMLSDEGFPDKIISTLKVLTRDSSVPYMDYIMNIKESRDSLAIAVKLVDLKHNSDLSRLESVDEQAAQRYFKYMEAIAILDNDNWKMEDMQYIYNTLKTRILDIISYAPSIGGRLSNLTKRAFVFDGVECGSIEGVLQSFKFSDPVRQKEICALFGYRAKKSGKNQDWKTNQTLFWQGISYLRDSAEYQELLDRLYQAVFEQNELFRDDLCVKAQNYKLLHSIGVQDIRETVLTEGEFISQLERLRNNA